MTEQNTTDDVPVCGACENDERCTGKCIDPDKLAACPVCGEEIEGDDGTAVGDAVIHYLCVGSDVDE